MQERDEKLPPYLQKKEQELTEALANLRAAYDIAIKAEEQLKDTLHLAKVTLDQNNS